MNEILVGQGFSIDVIFADPLQNPGEKFELLIGVISFVRRAELEELSPEADIGHEGGDDEYDRPASLSHTLDVLLRFTSFEAFKADMLAAKRAKRLEAEAVTEGMALYFSVPQQRFHFQDV